MGAPAEPTNRTEHEPLDERAFDQLLAKSAETANVAGESKEGVVIGRLVGFRDGEPLVTYPGHSGSAAMPARTTVDLLAEHVGHEVMILFDRGDRSRPIIAGRIRSNAHSPVASAPPHLEVDADGCRLTLSADEAIVLRCGKASITLTAAGKVLVQGTYVTNRSSGVMRIKGGSVQIN